MIQLRGVSRSFPGAGKLPRVVFRPSDLDIPADRPVAILGGRGRGKSVLLQLLGGRMPPEGGKVWRDVTVSPVINAGWFLHPSLTGIENIRFVARSYGVDADRLMLAADSFCGIGLRLTNPVRTLEGGERRALEAAVAMMLPFACYLLDDAQQLPPELLAGCVEAAAARGAGLIFATGVPRLARLHARRVVVIADATMQAFDDPGAAIAYHERAES